MCAEFEIYKLTCNNIRNRIRSKIKGYSRVGVENDTLVIYIDNDGFEFTFEVKDYLKKITCEAVTADSIVNEVVTTMRAAVLNKYFQKGES